jgi:hypothetical protein
MFLLQPLGSERVENTARCSSSVSLGTCLFEKALTQQRLLYICLFRGRCPATGQHATLSLLAWAPVLKERVAECFLCSEELILPVVFFVHKLCVLHMRWREEYDDKAPISQASHCEMWIWSQLAPRRINVYLEVSNWMRKQEYYFIP